MNLNWIFAVLDSLYGDFVGTIEKEVCKKIE